MKDNMPMDSKKSCSCCFMCSLVCVLVIIGALNWGLIGLGGFLGKNLNVVNLILGDWPQVEWVVYILVGLAGIMKIFSRRCPCRNGSCETK